MMLRSDPLYPHRRAYVVKFRGDATPPSFAGRVENLVTCTQREFASLRQLLEFIVADMQASESDQ